MCSRERETRADPIFHVAVDVIVDVDDRTVHEHIVLNVWTTRSRSERPCTRLQPFRDTVAHFVDDHDYYYGYDADWEGVLIVVRGLASIRA